jgi:hypothetical protein
VWSCLAGWTVIVATLIGIASVPTFRSPWSEHVVAARIEKDLLVSPPLTGFRTPYLSYIRVRLPVDVSATRLRASVVRGGEPVSSSAGAAGRGLLGLDLLPANADGVVAFVWTSGTATQFQAMETIRMVVQGELSEATKSRDMASADVTLGYDGKSAAVRPLSYWWPWMSFVYLAGVALVAWPKTWSWQRAVRDGARRTLTGHRRVLALLIVATALRFVLALQGGQYFDWDERLYAESGAIFELMGAGYVRGALDALLNAPAHPGFRLINFGPLFFHSVVASAGGHPVSDPRLHSGEWLGAFLLSLFSVASIALTYVAARRAGAGPDEGALAAFLMFCSSAMLVYSRYLLPYDAAMAIALLALVIGIGGRDNLLRSYAVGILCGAAFLTYEGYWLSTGVIGAVHILRRPWSPAPAARRALLSCAGAATLPGLLTVAGLWRGISFLGGMKDFAGTITNGDFAEGWSLPWKYLWHVEHALIAVYVIGLLMLAVQFRRGHPQAIRGLGWLACATAIYLGLGVSSSVLHRFVVYDRLARQLVPFICLAVSTGLSGLVFGNVHRSGVWLGCGGLALLFGWNAAPLFVQRHPREVVADAMAVYGPDQIRLGTTLARSPSVTQLFLPSELTQVTDESRRYVLLNVTDISIEDPPAGLIPRPPGRVLFSLPNPRQLPAMQYHGYTPAQREFLRAVDFSMQLVDTRPSQAAATRGRQD